MSQRRQAKVIAFQNSNQKSLHSKLNGVTCRMLPAQLPDSPLAEKIAQLQAARPAAAVFLERVIDDLLLDVS